MRKENGFIVELGEKEIIVVGTNRLGAYGGGAAKQAKDFFGLKEGIEEGLSGKTYAFPTLDAGYIETTVKALEDGLKLDPKECGGILISKLFPKTKK